MANMELIEAKTLGSAVPSVTFSSIPQTYTDLLLKCSVRSTVASLATSVLFTFNASTSNFTSVIVYGAGSGGGSSFTAARYAGSATGSTATASTFANNEIYIPNYTSSNYKSYSVDSVTETNATTIYSYLAAGLWSDTPAISSLTLTADSSGDFVTGSTFYLYGISNVTSTTKATGGILSSDGTYNYHMFPFSGTFTPTQSITADYLVVAGGGSGGFGGGGAGGLRSTVTATGGGGTLETALSLTAQAYTVTVGAGGGVSGVSRADGSNSSIIGGAVSIISTGGGCGGNLTINAAAGRDGGSSGGGGHISGANVQNAGTRTASPVQGNNGGIGGGEYSGGGGGGAGAAGNAGESANNSVQQTGTNGQGGNGAQITAFASATQTGANNGYYAAGGGGAYNAAGGFGGGGRGAANSGPAVGDAGTINTGSGGGGGNGAGGSGAGGSGIVIIRYAI